jgi:tetratricopeptide (TPR) repeat protein
VNNVSQARWQALPRALWLGALLGLLPLRLTAQSDPILNGRIGPDGKIQLNGTQPGTQAKPAAPALSPAAQKAAAQFDVAAKRQRQNQPAEALAAYQEYIRQVKAAGLPTRALIPAYRNIYLIYRQRDDHKSMETVLKQLVALAPDAGTLAELASSEATDHRYTEAAAYAGRALQLKPTPQIASPAHIVLAAAALDKRDYAHAEAECTVAIQLSPGNPGAHYYYALTLFRQQKYHPALAEAEKAHQIAPRLTLADLIIAQSKRQLQDTVGALAAYNELLKVEPRDHGGLFERATLLQQMGKADEAIVAYNRELALYPQEGEAHLNLGALYYARKNYPLAEQQFAAAQNAMAAHDPHDTRALRGLAQTETVLAAGTANARERSAIGKQAENHYKEALARDSKDFKLPFLLAELYRHLGRYDDAIAIYRQRLAVAPDEKDSYFGLNDVYLMQLRGADAIEVWKAYRKRKPEDPLSYERVAALLEMQGKGEEAIPEYTHLLAFNPQDGNAHLALAKAYDKLKQTDRAEAEYKTLLTYDPTAKDKPIRERPAAIADRQAWRLAGWHGLAKSEEDRGHLAEAIAYLDRVRVEEAAQAKKDETQPKAQVYIDIARLYALDKKPDMAINELTALTEVAPDDPLGFAALGEHYEAIGKTDEAAFALRKASQRSKDPIDYALKAAEVYRRQGDLAKTIAEYEYQQPKSPHDPRLLAPLAQTLELQGKDEQAYMVYVALLQANPDLHWVEDRQATILTRLKRYDEARAMREKQLLRNQDDAQVYADIARIYNLQGKPGGYLAWLKTRAEKKSAQPALLGAIVDEYTRQGKADAGWDYLRELISRHQDDTASLAAYAEVLVRGRRVADVADVRGRLAALNPKDIEAQTEYADSLNACGRKIEAAQVFQTQVARADLPLRDRMALRQLWAQRLEQEGNTIDAISQYQAIARAQPQNIEAVSALVRLLRSAQKPDALIVACTELVKQPQCPPVVRTRLLDTIGLTYEQQNNRGSARIQYRQALQIDPNDRAATEGLKRVGEN